MIKRVYKTISIFLIVALLFGRGFSVMPAIAEDLSPTPAESSSATSSPTSAPTNEEILAAKMAALNADLAEVQRKVDAINAATNTTANTTATPTGFSSLPTGTTGTTGTTSPASGVSPTGSIESSDPSVTGTSVNDPANVGTGPLSTNDAIEKYNQQMETLNKNLAEVQNKVDAINSTGFNSANFNSLNGQVFTGDAQTSLNLLNKLNSNMTGTGSFSVFDVYDTYVGNIVFQLAGDNVTQAFDNASGTVSKNAVTGADSTNNAVSESDFKVKEANGNDAKIENDIDLQAISGENTASFNTGDGLIQTGNATAVGNVVNMANTNLNVAQWLIGVVNIWGTMIGDIILPQEIASTSNTTATTYVGNEDTGALSTNNATYTSNTTASFENINDAAITSDIESSANTGNNTASVNTGGGAVKSGDADVSVSNSTVANVNTVNEEETVWMIIVNQAGKWVGYILGQPWGATSASNALPVTQTESGGGTQTYTTLVENTATGPMSDNNSSFTENSDTAVTNNNTASITNNITADADTGNNEAMYNTGAGIIDTGDAEVGLNIVNMVNTNVTAKKFVAILVNVMGKFLGDIIPVQEEDSSSQVAPIITPTPVLEELPALGGIDPIDVVLPTLAPLPTIAVTTTAEVSNQIVYIYENFDYAQAQSQQQYMQAVDSVNYAKRNIIYKRNQIANQVQNQVNSLNQTKIYTRGLFLSPTFAKATEPTITGILLGGATFKVNDSWLSVIPIAFLIVLLRRRRKFDFNKYLNALLEIIL